VKENKQVKTTRLKVVIALVVVAAAVGFYWFRPDRLFSNLRVDEGMPYVQGNVATQAIESGTFYTILHPTSGNATIYRMADGSHMLRLMDFNTSNGPDVHVYMVASDDAKDAATVERAGFVDLGSIKGNVGNQNYTLPTNLDLEKYRAVSIWCKRFSVNFGAAALKSAESSQVQ
jgi:hypothetical protein